MTYQTLEISPRSYAKIAGLLYLIIAVAGGFSIGYVPSVIIVDGDGAATAQALIDHQALFRLGILGDTIVLLAEIVLTVMLFVLFKRVSRTLAMIAASARFSMIVVMAINLLINILPLILLGGAGDASFDRVQWQNHTMNLFKAHQYGVYIWGILFALHLLALGYLVVKSGLFPRVLGWMMLVGSFGYSIEGISKITATHSDVLSWLVVALLTLVTIGELAFAFWLLIWGLNLTVWQDRHGQAVEI